MCFPRIVIEAFPFDGTLVVDRFGTVHCRHRALLSRSSQRAYTPKVFALQILRDAGIVITVVPRATILK